MAKSDNTILYLAGAAALYFLLKPKTATVPVAPIIQSAPIANQTSALNTSNLVSTLTSSLPSIEDAVSKIFASKPPAAVDQFYNYTDSPVLSDYILMNEA